MAQPPAWLRHQAVEASARAMVSITWKKVIGSVSMPFVWSRHEQAEQLLLMQPVEQVGRQAALFLDLGRGGGDGGPHDLGAGDHGRIARQLGGSRDQRVQVLLSSGRYQSAVPASSSRSICSFDLPRVSMPKK